MSKLEDTVQEVVSETVSTVSGTVSNVKDSKYKWRIVYVLLILASIYFGIWIFRSYGGNRNTMKVVNEVTSSLSTTVKRVDNIVSANTLKEEEVREKVSKQVNSVSDDSLADAFNALVASSGE